MEFTLIITGGILLGCIIGISWFAGSDAPYVATKTERIKKALKLSGLKKGQKFYELGSGDGRVVIEAAKLDASAVGIEQSLLRILWSSYKLASHSSSGNVKFIHGNIFKYNLSEADVVFIFLLPKGISKLEPKLQKELKKGSKIITQTFHFKNWKPYKKVLISDKKNPNTKLSKDGKLEGDFWYYRV